MSIKVVCPNGHEIRVKNSSAGKTGLCPTCKARVTVPEIERRPLSEEAVMDLLGEPEAGGPLGKASPTESLVEAGEEADFRVKPAKKMCKACEREIDTDTHICPFCHTYVGAD